MEEGYGGLPRAKRSWFYDVRAPARRMAVSTHEAEGITVVSFWQGDTCTATFRLPLADSSRLIAVLADGMAAGLPVGGGGPQLAEPAPSWRRWLRRLLTGRQGLRSGRHLWVAR